MGFNFVLTCDSSPEILACYVVARNRIELSGARYDLEHDEAYYHEDYAEGEDKPYLVQSYYRGHYGRRDGNHDPLRKEVNAVTITPANFGCYVGYNRVHG